MNRSLRAADCDTDHYLVVAKIKERLAVNKKKSRSFHMERFHLKEVELDGGKRAISCSGLKQICSCGRFGHKWNLIVLGKLLERI
jgi:hypothetical protein